MKRKLFIILALLCAFAQGAWAQNEWDEVYALTQTTSANWTPLNAGSATGQTLGSAGATSYYYITGDLNFANSNAGGSGLTIQGTVYLYVPDGVTLTCTGANANGATGAGAGIELASGNTLYLLGTGTVNATGGNAANGGNGNNGGDASANWSNNDLYSGAGGAGGNGGGGAGSGIGTRGGNGGSGGSGGARHERHGFSSWDPADGNNGSAGNAGITAGAMGNLYRLQSFANLSATGGAKGSSAGTGGNFGHSVIWDGDGSNYPAPGGSGGGGGGYGGAASNIGTGGPGGGGGGGGAGGCIEKSGSGYYESYSWGARGGYNGDETVTAGSGGTAACNTTYINEGWCTVIGGSFDANDAMSESGNATDGTGGTGGDCGYISLVLWPFEGAGSYDDPYLINSADDWTSFAHNVSNGNNYSGQYVKLTNDISVTTMAGGYQADDNYQPFSGTFDGDGHTLTLNVNNQSRFAAPFKCVSGATIKNLRTAGTIDGTGNADGKLLAGIIGVSFGNTTITGCRSSVTLTTDLGEDAALAGLVAGTKGGSLTIEGCVFEGSMTGSSNTRCAGIAGYDYPECGGTTTTIRDCLFIPATLTISTADDSYTKTFSRDPDATITGCYYTQPLGAAQGTAAYFGNINVPNTLGDLVTDYGVVKAYANGLFFNGKYYYSDAGSEENPYIIDSENALARIASIVNSGVSDFVGKHFSLICDLDLSGRNWIPIGTTDRPFRGNFNGNNHTISNLNVNNPSGDYNGLFGWVEGYIDGPNYWFSGCDYIKNFVVKNANVRGRNYTGGVAGRVHGQLDFENVILDGATVQGASFTSGFIGSAEGDYDAIGTLEGYSELHVHNCLFVNGSVTENTSHVNYDFVNEQRNSYVIFGNIERHSVLYNNYFSNVTYNGAAAPEDYYNVQAYPITVNAPSNINYSVESALGINYNDAYYVPDTLWRRDVSLIMLPIIDTVHLRLSYNDASLMVTSVKVNGVEVGTAIGNYDIIVNGRIATSYTVTVECEPGLTGSGTEDAPYLITSTELWDWFAISVNNGAHYSGKFVRLDADINISTTVGLRGDKPFSGTFLGNGHTLTTNISSTTTGTGANEQGVAPFHYIKDATIKDLTVAGTIASASYHTGGLVGFADGTNLIENCIVTATLDISSDYAGGIVGHGQGSTTTIRGCAFAGTINGVDGDRNNIGGIWGWSDSGTPALENCLEAGTYTNIASMHPMGLQRNRGNITNCYYLNPQVGEPSNACTVSGAYRAYTVNTVDGEMLRPLVLVDGNTYYTPCLIAVDDYYHRTGSSVGVTPVVTASNGTPLTLGTDYTATLNGEAVAAFPIDITTLGSKTFTITGLGNCNGSKSANFIVYGVNGEGTEESPYLISDDLEWASFAFYVNSGNSYSGKFVGLDADISVSEMAGSSETYSFQGTFLGNGHTLTFTKGSAESAFDEEYCAPFRHVKNATIQDLKVAGAIYTSRKFTAGLVAHSYGTTNITDCQVGTFIHSILNGDGTHGGIVSMPSGTLNIEGCAYTGRLLTNNGTNNCSGFVGWSGQNTAIVITNSLYDPSGDIPSGWSAINHGATFVYGNRGNITNCYYTETMVSAQGTLVCALSATSPTNLGELVREYDVLKAYENGILFNGTYYIGPAIFSGTGTRGNPYLISNDYEWRSLASHVNNGNDFSGKFVKLTANIDITTPVGSRASDSDNKPFCGTFLGDGHTITAALDDDGNQGLALFRYINGATIRDLKVAGTIASSQYHTSGLVGFADGTNLIENCAVTATLNISSDYAGGIVGHGRTSTTTIRGCAFAGTINGVDGDRYNIGGIWGWSTSGTPTLVDCMEAGTYTNIASMHPMGLQGGSGTITNCFYVTPQIGNPTNACTVSGASQTYSITPGDYVTVANAGFVSNEYSVSGLTFYTVGLQYNDMLYAASGDAVSLNLNSSASSAEYHASAGTLSGSENPYTLTMPGENVVINMHALQSIGTTVWYAIATPMHDEGQDNESISSVTNLTTDNYDLLRYDEASATWENQKAGNGALGFSTLEPGRGYIYRCSAPRTLTYTGVPNSKESYSVSLTATSAAGDLKGFNLVGNPYPFSVTMYRPFYSLGADGIWQAHASGESLEAGQGALVYATSNETLTFYAATRSTNSGMDALPALPKALCLGGNGDDPSNHAISQSVNLPFAHQDGNSIVVTGTGTLQAYDIMGRLLFRMELNTEHLTLNTSLFPSAGVYLLRLGDKSQKIVIR